ncbi:MAG: hypothetical protein ICV54_24385 [Nostoc sp. C3-bin3]|nr:hypothetical protein [Nostoc sp. C3-bin3]
MIPVRALFAQHCVAILICMVRVGVGVRASEKEASLQREASLREAR